MTSIRLLPSSCLLPPVVCRLLPVFCLLLTAVCLLPTARAQSATATLSGTVEDQNNAIIAGANVTVINLGTGLERKAVSNENGFFVVALLPPSSYTVRVEREGFAPVEIRDVVLNVNDQRSLQIQLRVGQVDATIEVKGDTPLIKQSAEVSTIVDRQFVENMPLNGRSFQTLIALTPGVVLTKTTSGEGVGQFSVNGQRANANYFMVDGVSANTGISAISNLSQSGGGALPSLSAAGGTNSFVSVDAMQEFKIQTSTFAPEFGRTPGAQVSIVTRSGTNDFHGTLFEYFRNDVLDANDWFANSRRLRRPALRQNDFGGVLGGPLYLPRFGEGGPNLHSGKNRTFFFLSYEGLRLRLPQTQISFVPSMASRQAASPSRRPFLDAYPIPNGQVFANGFAEFNASYSNPLSLDATSIRIDHALGERLTLFGRYNHSPSETTDRGTSSRSLNSLNTSEFETQTLTIGATQTFTPSITNEMRANYSKSEGANLLSLDGFGGAVAPADSLLFAPFVAPQSFFRLQLTGGRFLTTGKNAINTQRQINLVDNLSVVAKAHQLKFGTDYRLLLPINSPRPYEELVRFSGLSGPTGLISGNAQTVTVTARDTIALSFTNFSAYGQDTWKATSRLTLTFGLRWDLNPAPKGRNGKDLFTFENPLGPAPLRLLPRGTRLYETTYSNFAPRLGLVYQLSQKQRHETVLRGGFGIFYDLGSGVLGNAATLFPYLAQNSFSNVPFPLTPSQAIPPAFSLNIPASGNASVAARNLSLPRTYQWNAAVEQSLGSNQTFSASYVGAIGRRLLRTTSIISPRAFFIEFTDNSATSDYHALQLQFQRRLSKGLQVLASYTWSHSIDIASTDSLATTTPLSPTIDRGPADFDVRHAFNTALTYDIPAPTVGRVARILLGNWSVDTITTARSATPVNLVARIDSTGGFQSFVRPNLVTGIPLYIADKNVAGGRRFNPAAFVAPATGRQGTLGRNVLRGFPVFQVDLALRRKFDLTEHWNLQLRAEFFNLFNHPNFGDPGNFEGNFLASPAFGQSTWMLGRSLGTGGNSGGFNPLYQIGGPRSIQFALKLNF